MFQKSIEPTSTPECLAAGKRCDDVESLFAFEDFRARALLLNKLIHGLVEFFSRAALQHVVAGELILSLLFDPRRSSQSKRSFDGLCCRISRVVSSLLAALSFDFDIAKVNYGWKFLRAFEHSALIQAIVSSDEQFLVID